MAESIRNFREESPVDEAKRFLRYITPGLVFAVQAFVLCFILDWTKTISLLGSLKKDAGLGFAAAAFLLSGGLGYIFSVTYHWFHHGLPWVSPIDFRKFVNYLQDENIITVVRKSKGELSRFEARVVFISLWRPRLKEDTANGGFNLVAANPATVALTDQMHAAGTAFVSAIVAGILALIFYHLKGGDIPACWLVSLTLVVWGFFLVLHAVNYRRLAKMLLRYNRYVLYEALKQEKEKPIQVILDFPPVSSTEPQLRPD